MKEKNPAEINCLECEHFAVTWEPKFPRGCKLYGFKSASFPSIEVFRSSGAECMGFAKKERGKRPDGE